MLLGSLYQSTLPSKGEGLQCLPVIPGCDPTGLAEGQPDDRLRERTRNDDGESEMSAQAAAATRSHLARNSATSRSGIGLLNR
jgi:hypothetical protein